MKFIINNQTLQTELAFLAGVAQSKPNTIPVLQNLRIQPGTDKATSLKLTATDLDVTLTLELEASVEKTGTILLPIGKLLAITKTLPKTADLSFQSNDNGGATLTCERATFKMLAPDPDGFPKTTEPKKGALEIPTDVFHKMIESTIYAITQEESRYTLSGAKLEIDQTSMRMITTDGHRLAFIENKEITTDDKIEVLIPRKTLAELAKISAAYEGTLRLALDENHIYFQVGSRLLTSRLLYGQFPNYDMVIPKSNDQTFTTNSATFREAVRRVALMADERSHAIRLDIRPGELNISAQTPEDGEAIETVPIEFDGEECSIGFNSAYLADFYNLFNGNDQITIAFKDSNSQVLLKPEAIKPSALKGVVMPLRLN